MSDTRSREPTGSADQPEPQALASQRKCPNCGREPAVVFTMVQTSEGKPLPHPHKVCLACCPKIPAHS
jgi:hypothetical protein